jgi:hypothetical protein
MHFKVLCIAELMGEKIANPNSAGYSGPDIRSRG